MTRCGSRCWAAAPSGRRSSGCWTSRPTTWPRGSALRWSSSGSRCGGPARHPDVPADLLTTDAAGAGGARRRRPRRRGDRRHRAGPHAAAQRAASRQERRVSANKALLAEDGATLHDAAARAGVDLYYEAAVAGAIPLLRPLRESLAGDRITRVIGIVNGTTNFILSRMDATGAGFAEALAEATALGYAEADPDRRHRRLRRRREGRDPRRAGVPHPGHRVRRLPRGHRRGDRRGHRQRQGDGLHGEAARHLRAHRRQASSRAGAPGDDPAHPSAGRRRRRLQRGVRRGRRGRLADVLRPRCGRRADGQRRARRPRRGGPQPAARRPRRRARAPTPTCRSSRSGEVTTRYHVALDVADQPGVLAAVAGAFADHGVSIQTVRQEGRGDAATLVLVTHTATDAAVCAGRSSELSRMPFVRRAASVMRVEGVRLTGERTRDVATLWPGVIEAYRARLPVTDAHAGGHPARGRHAAASPPASCPSAPDARSTSRSRAPTRPARSRTAA